jgi:hypothetical protein
MYRRGVHEEKTGLVATLDRSAYVPATTLFSSFRYLSRLQAAINSLRSSRLAFRSISPIRSVFMNSRMGITRTSHAI